MASPAFVVAVEADECGAFCPRFSGGGSTGARPARHLLTLHSADDAAAVLSLPQPRRSVPLPFARRPGVPSLTFLPPSRNFLPLLPRKLRYLALEDAYVSDRFAASFEAAASRAEVEPDAFVVAVDAEVAADDIVVTLQHSFLTFLRHWPWKLPRFLRTMQRQHF